MANILVHRRLKVPLSLEVRAVEETPKLAAVSPTSSSQDSKEKLDTVDNVNDTMWEDFSSLDLNFEWETPSMLRVWHTFFGVAAFFDFAAAMLDKFYELPVDDLEQGQGAGQPDLVDRISLRDQWESTVEWLQTNSLNIQIVFAVLWFVDAFLEANRRRVQASRELDRQRLLHEKGPYDQNENWLHGSWGVYYRTIAFQLLLLPVGFFVFCYSGFRRLQDPDIAQDDQVLQIVHRTDDDAVLDEYETFTANASMSLGFAILKHLAITFSRRTGTNLRRLGVRHAKAGARWLLYRALHNPFKFRRHILQMLTVSRWVKYLAPLFGAINKLLGNISDLHIKLQQRRAAAKARAIRKKLWHDLPPDELREHCALLIQKIFRAHQARKILSALNMIRDPKEQIAVIKVQKMFRGMAYRARQRLPSKKLELKRLQVEEQAIRANNGKQKMKASDRRRMYRLQEELHDEAAHLLNDTLLLRPNTSFAVVWKILFVVAILFEISQLALKPWLKKYKNAETGRPLDIESIIEHKLIPTPVSQLDVCEIQADDGPRVLRAIRRLFRKFTRRKPPQTKPLPWYCHKTFATAQTVYIKTFEFLIHEFLVLMGVICFLDVFVTFFTGEIAVDTGILSPKPFFARWFVPGLVMHLAINPKVESASRVVMKVCHTRICCSTFLSVNFHVLAYPCVDDCHITGSRWFESPWPGESFEMDSRAVLSRLYCRGERNSAVMEVSRCERESKCFIYLIESTCSSEREKKTTQLDKSISFLARRWRERSFL
jgi:hypothetical protein